MTASTRSIAARLLGVSAVFLLGAAAAQAETYEGVHPMTGALSRAEVQAQGVQAAHDPRQNIPSASVVAALPAQPVDRASVQAEAVRAAASYQSGEIGPAGWGAAPYLAHTLPAAPDARAQMPGNTRL